MSLFRRKLLESYATNKLVYPGLIAAWSAKGKTNDDVDRNVLKDLTGNGHDITLNNFAWNTESGYSNPKYPDALVFDGVDDYGVNENMPILTDFTLIINKSDIYIPEAKESFYISKSASVGIGAFILGFTNLNSKNTYYSLYGNPNYYNYENWPILYVTPNLFNGSVCFKGGSSDSKILVIGSIRPGDHRMWTGSFYSAYLFDRSLDEQEIKSFIRKYIDPEYLLPSEIPTPPPISAR